MTVDTTAPIRLGRFKSGTDEFQQARQARLGGSEIAAVLGLSPYESHLSLWWRKAGLAPPKTFDTAGAQLTEWGNRLEPIVWAKFVEDHSMNQAPGELLEFEYSPGTYIHPERQWQMASPDGWVANLMGEGKTHGDLPDDLVEVKTAQNEYEWGEPGTDQIPVYYRTQCLWNMDVMDAVRCWIPVLVRGAFYKEYVIERDDAAETDIAILRDAGQKFIDSLNNNEPPPIDGHDATYAVIRERHPDIDPGDIKVDGGLADAFIAAAVQEKEAKEAKQRWAAEIMQAMGASRNAIHEHTEERFAFRTPASNPQRTPYLRLDSSIYKAIRPALTIQGTRT